MKNRPYEMYNAQPVLDNVNKYIDILTEKKNYQKNPTVRTRDVCDELSIFDWWVDVLSITRLLDMKKFLEEAIKLGFTGYVCFKVGATGCANGMWAHTAPTTNGYSPNGRDYIYKSFTPAYNYWDICYADNTTLAKKTGRCYDEITSVRTLEKALKEVA